MWRAGQWWFRKGKWNSECWQYHWFGFVRLKSGLDWSVVRVEEQAQAQCSIAYDVFSMATDWLEWVWRIQQVYVQGNGHDDEMGSAGGELQRGRCKFLAWNVWCTDADAGRQAGCLAWFVVVIIMVIVHHGRDNSDWKVNLNKDRHIDCEQGRYDT